MQYLHSIESIEPHHVIDTGCRPLLVHANTMETYLVKYVKGTVPANMLAREWVAAQLCAWWDISFPKTALVEIQEQHLSPELQIGFTKLERAGMGTLFDNRMKEVDRIFDQLTYYQSAKFVNKDDFLKIAFFDIWISNDDRHAGNYNLMVKSEPEGYRFVAIDHGACWHTGNQDKPNYPISLQESLINSPLTGQLFTQKQLFNNQMLRELHDSWYLCAENCTKHYNEIIATIPEDWNINKQQLSEQLSTFMMNSSWFNTCWDTFLEYLQRIKSR